MPAYAEAGKPEQTGSEKTEVPPSDAKPAVPPYEDRQTSAKPDTGGDAGGAREGGAVKPVSGDADYKAPSPQETPGGATASPAEEQPAASMPETDRGDDMTGPAHVSGTEPGEQHR